MKMTTDTLVFSLAEAYCLAKPFWWQIFFGWRRSRYDKERKCTEYYYKIKDKDWKNILEYAKYAKK